MAINESAELNFSRLFVAFTYIVVPPEWFPLGHLPVRPGNQWIGIGEFCLTFTLLCYASIAGKTLLYCSPLVWYFSNG